MRHVLVNDAGGFSGGEPPESRELLGPSGASTAPMANESIASDRSDRRLAADAGVPVGKRADPAAHGQIARWPLYSFKLIHPTFMGKTSWFRRYRYRPDAIRCEDMDLLFRARAGSRFANLPEIVLGYRQGSLGLRKCLRGRWMWFHCSGRYLSSTERLRVGALEAFKSCWDILAVAAHADAAWLRSRYAALTEEELREWRQVWDSVS